MHESDMLLSSVEFIEEVPTLAMRFPMRESQEMIDTFPVGDPTPGIPTVPICSEKRLRFA